MGIPLGEYEHTRCDQCLFGTVPTNEQYSDLIAYFAGMGEAKRQSEDPKMRTIEEKSKDLASTILSLIKDRFPPDKVIYCNHPDATGSSGARINPHDSWCTIVLSDETYGFEAKEK
ncbi:MAG: hypothetical protein NUV98_06175 [Candidatus Roizmanbacteria bacterium]|nr:hypothetical protein [Candidatus Roizmanbacteria bacterium]